MLLRIGKILVIAALVLSTGAHWAALQAVAWTTMLAANWSSESFSTAITHTFDGEHLCPLCKAIAIGKKSEQKKEFNLQSLKLDFLPAVGGFVLIAPKAVTPDSGVDVLAESFLQKPPVPPPRSRFV